MSAAAQARRLEPSELRRRCDLAQAGFATTDELAAPDGVLAQARAVEAIRFAVEMQADGYNLYAMGPEGYGRHTTVRRLLAEQSARRPPACDWCYVFNFDAPHRPRRLQLPAGRAGRFAADMQRLVEDLLAAIPAAFETDEYRARRQEIEVAFGERQEKAIVAIGERARQQGIALLRTPAGFAFAPLDGEAVMDPEKFRTLPQPEQERIEALIAKLQEELERVIREVPRWRREAQRALRELNRQVTKIAVASLIEELKAQYAEFPAVLEYLGRVQEDVLDHAEVFRTAKEAESAPAALPGLVLPRLEPGEAPLKRYQVNVLVDHGGADGAPVVYEDHPSHGNLVGRIEHIAHMGALVTDFTLIKAGALHRANGGYLVLDALKVLAQPFAWEALKRALRSREVRVESPAQSYGLISTVSLEPEPVPLELKVVLVGDRLLYYLLYHYDPEFRDLFKVASDFEEDAPRVGDTELAHARLVALIVREARLRPLERSAVEAVIEHAAREAGDAEKLSLHLRGLSDLLRETDHWARTAGRAVATRADVRRAVAAREHRLGRLRERLREQVLRGTLLVSTQGERVAQVNGLSVIELGGFAFGTPHRITARVRAGSGRVVDIERETELGGPIHSKGVLILAGYLAGRYAPKVPLSLHASLVFEQSYSGVEGDSASSAELYALLSALAEVPIRQSLAVTGSVNQHGDIQAVGGVNEKIEGFFDVCRERGLDGSHGVLIPAANVKHLMLREDVVEAVAAGRFAIYAVETVDQGIARLTDLSAAEVNRRIEERLADYAERARASGAPPSRRRTWRAKEER